MNEDRGQNRNPRVLGNYDEICVLTLIIYEVSVIKEILRLRKFTRGGEVINKVGA